MVVQGWKNECCRRSQDSLISKVRHRQLCFFALCSMDIIHFEQQEALLCAQHALNMLLQGEYFSADVLGEIARKLDEEENSVLDASSRNRESVNVNDSGFFSVQVMAEALKQFHLDLVPIDHPSVADIKKDPLKAVGFICNRSEHWFTIRRFGRQWFELNSAREGPELMTDTHVALTLDQLTRKGYAIFYVRGVLPHCAAEEVISRTPILPGFMRKEGAGGQQKEAGKKAPATFSGAGAKLGRGGEEADMEEDPELAEAIRLSLGVKGVKPISGSARPSSHATTAEEEERQLALALSMSMEGAEGGTTSSAPVSAQNESDVVRRQRAAFLDRLGN